MSSCWNTLKTMSFNESWNELELFKQKCDGLIVKYLEIRERKRNAWIWQRTRLMNTVESLDLCWSYCQNGQRSREIRKMLEWKPRTHTSPKPGPVPRNRGLMSSRDRYDTTRRSRSQTERLGRFHGQDSLQKYTRTGWRRRPQAKLL